MKKNLKYNITWLALAAVIYFGLFAAYNGGLINLFSDAIIVNIGINIILAVGLNLIIGFSGTIFFRSCRFYGDWCYAGAILTANNPTFGGFLFWSYRGDVRFGADRTSCRDSNIALERRLLSDCNVRCFRDYPYLISQFTRIDEWTCRDIRVTAIQ